MQDHRSAHIFPIIQSFEEFEIVKLNTDIIKKAVAEIINQHHLLAEPFSLFSEGTNIVIAYGNDKVIKIFPPLNGDQFKSEKLVLSHLQDKISIKTPRIEHVGEIDGWPYIVINRLEGTLLEDLWEKMDHNNKMIIMRELGVLIREVHSLSTVGLEAIDSHWEQFIRKQINHCVEQHRITKLPEFLVQQIPIYLEALDSSWLQIKKPVLLTGEYTPMNFIVKKTSGIWHINGLIDFGDAMLGLAEYDLLGPGAFLIQGDKRLLKTFLISYGYSEKSLNASLSHQLTALMLLHRYSNLNIQIRIKDWKNKVKSIKDLENVVWGF